MQTVPLRPPLIPSCETLVDAARQCQLRCQQIECFVRWKWTLNSYILVAYAALSIIVRMIGESINAYGCFVQSFLLSLPHRLRLQERQILILVESAR